MDPISIGLGVVGLGMQLFGGMQASGIAKQQAQVSAGIAADEQQINAQKQLQMQLESRRMQLQTIRNAQRMRAQGTAAAVNQGAQFGSGLAGALAQNTSEGTENLLGINQAMEISNHIAGFNEDISGKKSQLAALGGDMASAQGMASLGGSLVKMGPIAGAFGKDIGAGMGGLSLFKPGSLSGGLTYK